MVKKLTFFAVVLMISLSAFSQGQMPLEVGAKQLNFGVFGSQSGFPVYIGMDFGFKEDITLGGEIRPSFWGNGIFMGLVFNADYHFNKLLDMPNTSDFYAGLNLGWDIWLGANSGSSGIYLGGHVGGRYFWNEKWGVNAEIGLGNNYSGGKVGLTMKLGGTAD